MTDSEIKEKIEELRDDNVALEGLLPDDAVQDELDKNIQEINDLKFQFDNIRLTEQVDEEDYDLMNSKKDSPVSDEIVDVVGLMPKDWLYKEGGKTEHYKYSVIVSRENSYKFKKELEKLGYMWDSYDEQERYANIHFGLTPSQYKKIRKNSDIISYLSEDVEEYGVGGFVLGLILGGYTGYKVGVIQPQRELKDLLNREKKIIKDLKKDIKEGAFTSKKGQKTKKKAEPQYTEYEDVTYEKNFEKGGRLEYTQNLAEAERLSFHKADVLDRLENDYDYSKKDAKDFIEKNKQMIVYTSQKGINPFDTIDIINEGMDKGEVDKHFSFAKGGKIEGLKNNLKDVEKALENTEEGGEEYAVLQEEQHRLDSKISQMEFVSQLDPDSKNYNPKTETYLKRKGYAKGGFLGRLFGGKPKKSKKSKKLRSYNHTYIISDKKGNPIIKGDSSSGATSRKEAHDKLKKSLQDNIDSGYYEDGDKIEIFTPKQYKESKYFKKGYAKGGYTENPNQPFVIVVFDRDKVEDKWVEDYAEEYDEAKKLRSHYQAELGRNYAIGLRPATKEEILEWGKSYSKGGLTKGKSHAEGGIPMKVKDTGQDIEVEGGEIIVNKYSSSSNKTNKFNGKELTNCEVISEINEQDGNGVKIDCDSVEGKKYKYQEGGKFAKGGILKKGTAIEIVGDDDLEQRFGANIMYIVNYTGDGYYYTDSSDRRFEWIDEEDLMELLKTKKVIVNDLYSVSGFDPKEESYAKGGETARISNYGDLKEELNKLDKSQLKYQVGVQNEETQEYSPIQKISDLDKGPTLEYATGGKIGDTIRLLPEPYMVSFGELYNKDLTITGINKISFASGDKLEYVVKLEGIEGADGKEYNIKEDFIQSFNEVYKKGGDLKDKLKLVNKPRINELENEKGKIESELESLRAEEDYDIEDFNDLNMRLGSIYEEIRIMSYGKNATNKTKLEKGGKTEPNSGDFFKEEVDEYGYSYSNYKNGEWEKIYNFLIKEGNSREETKEIMLSKHTRWALDKADGGKSEGGTLKDFKKYYQKYKGKWFDKGGTIAEMYEIIDVSENNKFDSVVSFDDLIEWTKELAFTQSLESPTTIKDAQDVLAKNNLIAVEFAKGGMPKEVTPLQSAQEDIEDLEDSLQWLSGQDKRYIEREIEKLKSEVNSTQVRNEGYKYHMSANPIFKILKKNKQTIIKTPDGNYGNWYVEVYDDYDAQQKGIGYAVGYDVDGDYYYHNQLRGDTVWNYPKSSEREMKQKLKHIDFQKRLKSKEKPKAKPKAKTKAKPKAKPKKKKQSKEELLEEIESDMRYFSRRVNADQSELSVENDEVVFETRHLGNWENDEEDRYDDDFDESDWEDNDQRIWVDYDKYNKIFKDWGKDQKWYKKVNLDLDVSEKDWVYFTIRLK